MSMKMQEPEKDKTSSYYFETKGRNINGWVRLLFFLFYFDFS